VNQNDLIQKIMAAEHQAQALTAQAKIQQDTMEDSITAEIADLRKQYEDQSQVYLQQLEQEEQKKSAKDLAALDQKLAEKLSQVEGIYESQKDQWVQSIFERIVGKAGG
jgi:uncharacterized protein HemX